MRRLILSACVLIGFGLAAAHAVEPSAHEPQFAQAELWPAEVQQTAYYNETWPAAPLFVWTATGKAGKETDPKNPANWAVDGKPASTVPGEADDVLFPTGTVIRLKEFASLTIRHVTVGKSVEVAKLLQLRPKGNIWIKESGSVAEMGNFTGPKHVFLRNDNRDFRRIQAYIANKVSFNKPLGSSLEIVGTIVAHDEMGFFCGTVIVGPGARLVPGNRSSQPIYPDAKLVLMSGSSFHKRGNQPYETDLIVSGQLLAGTAERPLTKDCTLGLSFKTKGEKGILTPEPNGANANDFGLVVNPSGTLSVQSADPAKARLVITWNGLSSSQHHKSDEVDPIDRWVDVVLQGKVSLTGVHFDRIRTGGVHLADPAMRTTGTLTFGEHNHGKPVDLFMVLAKPIEAKLVYSAASLPKPASQGGGKVDNPDENR